MNLKSRLAKLELRRKPARWVPAPEMIMLDENDPQSVAAYEARCAEIEADDKARGYKWREGDHPRIVVICGPDPDAEDPDAGDPDS